MLSTFQLLNAKKIKVNYDNIKITSTDYTEIRSLLNSTKDLLNDIPSTRYRAISLQLDTFSTLRSKLHKQYNVQVVTNATLKMFELLEYFKLVTTRSNTFNVFCNAELPGGFIVAINHYIKTKYPTTALNWLASSYISNNTLDDIYGIYERNKKNWIMDSELNGDITKITNIILIEHKVLSVFPKGVDLYTSDVGIDISSNYNTQEEQTLLLNYCQILCGLLTVKVNGNMLIKQFTFFTSFNSSLLILLSNLFKSVCIAKPATSRPINSEIYVICKQYKGICNKLKQYLLSRVETVDKDIPLLLDVDTFYLQLIANKLYNTQIQEILKANAIYLNNSVISPINKEKQQEKWLKIYDIKPIKSSDHI